jgi:two-component system sensor histidine kinase HydH
MIQTKLTPHRAIISSWIVIGMSLILIVAVSLLAVVNYNREKKGMQQMLNEKGAALIKAFEAGTRTGMMGRFGSDSRLQTLLTETASQEDILYIALIDISGKVLAHNDPDQVGRPFTSPHTLKHLAATEKTSWRTIDQEGRPVSFEVYRKFLPVLPATNTPQMRGMRMNMRGTDNEAVWCQPGWMEGLPEDRILDPEERPIIFIGMDASPYVEAMREDFWVTLMTSAIILLLGMAGVVSLFWAQSYTRSRKLLQDSRAFAAEMVANLPEGIIATDPGRTITFINPIAMDMFGLAPEDSIGRPTNATLPADLTELMDTLPSGRKMVEQELSLTGKEGTKLTVAACVTDIVSEDNDFVGTMFILRDLTQIRRLQATVQKQEKLAAIGNLAAGVAHEVRNPLSSIKGYATYFASLFEPASEQRKAAEVMTAEVDRLNRVITELLEISRPSDIKRKQTDPAFLFNSSLRLVQQDAEAAGIRVTTSIDTRMTPLAVDPDRITQALINLYINAIQAMPDGGLLTVTAGDRGNGVVVTITDTGTGMNEETRNKIFDPYFTTKNTGTGLGLAVVQKVVEAHGGTIEVTSRENGGTSFTIFFPRNNDEETGQ